MVGCDHQFQCTAPSFRGRAVGAVERLPVGSAEDQLLTDYQVLGSDAGVRNPAVSADLVDIIDIDKNGSARAIWRVPATPVAICFLTSFEIIGKQVRCHYRR